MGPGGFASNTEDKSRSRFIKQTSQSQADTEITQNSRGEERSHVLAGHCIEETDLGYLKDQQTCTFPQATVSMLSHHVLTTCAITPSPVPSVLYPSPSPSPVPPVLCPSPVPLVLYPSPSTVPWRYEWGIGVGQEQLVARC